MSTALPLLLLSFLLFRNTVSVGSPFDGNASVSTAVAAPIAYRRNDAGNHGECTAKTLSEPHAPTGLNLDIPFMIADLKTHVEKNLANFSTIASKILLARSELAGIAFASTSGNYLMLALNVRGSVRFFRNRSDETEVYWKTLSSIERDGWAPSFRDCLFFRGVWLNPYVARTATVGLGLFLPLRVDQCDDFFADFVGGRNKCDRDTTIVSILFLFLTPPVGV